MAVTAPILVSAMRAADIAAVHEIERISFRTPWPIYAFEQELGANRMARYVVARAGDQVVGYAGLWLMADDAHVTTIAVHPEWRRRQIGRQLLLNLVELAYAMGGARMTLEVRPSNEAALALYRDFGFAVEGRRTRYYTDDGEDALVMSTSDLASPQMRRVVATERARWPLEDA